MITIDAFPVPDKPGQWYAYYVGRDGTWRVAADARGKSIECHSKQLAHSVAMYRRDRLLPSSEMRQGWL